MEVVVKENSFRYLQIASTFLWSMLIFFSYNSSKILKDKLLKSYAIFGSFICLIITFSILQVVRDGYMTNITLFITIVGIGVPAYILKIIYNNRNSLK